MEVLITGAQGFFGNYILQNFPHADSLGKNIKNNIRVDLGNSIPSFSKKYNLVIHCAALAHKTPMSRIDNNLFYQINYKGTLNLLRGLELTHVPECLLLISTVAVYGKISGTAINETQQLAPNSPYGLSKVLAEEEALKWGLRNNVKVTIFRLPLVVGNNPPGNLEIMKSGIINGYYFNIDKGRARKSMVLAKDIADIIPHAAKIGGIYNLTDGYHPSFEELSCLIAKQFGKSKPSSIPRWIAFIMAKVGDLIGVKAPINTEKLLKITSDLTFDDSKARKILGWKPTSVLEGLKDGI